jgi:hypothetical protein
VLRPFALHRPASAEEACGLLSRLGEDVVVYAGGTELLLLMKEGLLRPRHLVDVKRIPGLDAIADGGAALTIGAEGAVVQGLGHTLLEEMVYEEGHLLNGTLLIYRVPRAEDVPSALECRFVENADGSGPFGAKGAGEGSLIPVSPAVANAVARLTGLRLRELPLTPERVWRALRARQRG